MLLAGAPSPLPLRYSLQCVFLTVNHHSSLTFWEQGHLLPSASHLCFFLLCSRLYNRGPTEAAALLRYYFSRNQCSYTNTWLFFLSEFFIGKMGIMMGKLWGNCKIALVSILRKRTWKTNPSLMFMGTALWQMGKKVVFLSALWSNNCTLIWE